MLYHRVLVHEATGVCLLSSDLAGVVGWCLGGGVSIEIIISGSVDQAGLKVYRKEG